MKGYTPQKIVRFIQELELWGAAFTNAKFQNCQRRNRQYPIIITAKVKG